MFTLLLAMNRIRTILLVGLLIVSGTSYAQKGDFTPDKNSNWQDRIYFGGGFGLGGGTWGGSIRLSPMVGYMFTSKLSAGVGINYEYYWNNSYTPRLEDNRYGGLIFTRLNLFRNIFAYADYQFINLKLVILISECGGNFSWAQRVWVFTGNAQGQLLATIMW